jgi:hypothetical protein
MPLKRWNQVIFMFAISWSAKLAWSDKNGGQNPAIKWTRRELNPRPLRCERNDLPLIYEPKNERISENNLDI